MADDPFFNKVVLELMEPPAAVRESFAAALRNPGRTPAPHSELALQQATSWLASLLKAEYGPREDTAFVTIPLENGICDTIRARYRTDGVEVDTAQSRHLISITVRGMKPPPGATDLEKAQHAARQIFAKQERIRLQLTGPRQGGSFGQQGGPPFDKEWSYWVDSLRWWSEGDTIGFLLLRAPGGPNRAFITPEEADNRRWFQ